MNKEELTTWFDDYGESIRTYILLMVRDYQQAEDLTQETIEISLILEDSTLKQATDNLEPFITSYLFENGYDEYKLKFSEAPDLLSNENMNDSNLLYEMVREIVKEVFASYGYADEADYELAGLKQGGSSNIITLDMPDHIKDSKEIIESIKKEVKSQNLDIKDIEVNSFNLQHRIQDNRWAYISSDIYRAMAGKSTYKLTGLTYKVKDGHSYVTIKTGMENPPSEEIIQEIQTAIEEYFAMSEMKEQIQNDGYTIQFLLKNEKPFVEITN